MSSKQLCFGYKGGRDYVHGTDVFNKLVNVFELDEKTPFSVSFHKIIKTPSLLLVFSSKKERLDEESSGEKVAHGFFEKEGERIHFVLSEYYSKECKGESNPYDEQSIADRSEVADKRISVPSLGSFTFIENAVALNKHLLQTLFPDKKGKWLFTRIELTGVPWFEGELKLELLHNLNFKLTKTKVTCAGKPVGNLYFTMVAL